MLDFGSKDLGIPIIMVIFGLVLRFKPPSKINSFYGYRTTRSIKSQEAWDYAQRRIGGLWLYTGTILYIAINISLLILPASKESLSFIHGGIGIIALIIWIPFVQKELKEKFDEDGITKN
ncbi:SdpI family protein [Clostridium estertheticum]|uniref:SdpI family protein n=1 Tax=Clostridium estertheticum TaxID=238834 RepID=UPI0013E9355C|nr:SdpI family protein [Clostridium estertheticum]MBZ9688959.1 SdpI family protein [Clostridium estertheticum]